MKKQTISKHQKLNQGHVTYQSVHGGNLTRDKKCQQTWLQQDNEENRVT